MKNSTNIVSSIVSLFLFACATLVEIVSINRYGTFANVPVNFVLLSSTLYICGFIVLKD